MTDTSILSRAAGSVRRTISRLRGNTDGIAALEFAMVVPIMVTLFLGAVEFSEALTVDRRVTAIASSVADLVAQNDKITGSDLDDIMAISNSLLGTISGDPMWIEIASVSIDNNGDTTVDWSYDKGGGQPLAPGATYNDLPSGFTEPGNGDSSVIVADVQYEFVPKIGHYIVGSIGLGERFYLRPRKSLKVTKE